MFTATLLAAALAAPVPKAKVPELHYPVVEGTKWVMQRKLGKETVETTHTVTKVEEKDGTYTVTVNQDVGGQVREFRYEVSAKGILALPRDGQKGEPRAVLKLPAKEGYTWTAELPSPGNSTRTTTYTVGKEEVVEVPAGKFKAIAVATEVNANGQVFKSTSWIAVGVGVVKSVSAVGVGTEQVQELKEFTPGKAK